MCLRCFRRPAMSLPTFSSRLFSTVLPVSPSTRYLEPNATPTSERDLSSVTRGDTHNTAQASGSGSSYADTLEVRDIREAALSLPTIGIKQDERSDTNHPGDSASSSTQRAPAQLPRPPPEVVKRKFKESRFKEKPVPMAMVLPGRVKAKFWSVDGGANVRVNSSHKDILAARERVKADVTFAVQRVFGSKYSIEFFGSTRYGVSHRRSDLDMVIIDPDYPQGYTKEKFKESVYNVRKLAYAMKSTRFSSVDFRARSTVPIVKFKDPFSGLDCDLNVNERLGIVNSDMIKEFCDNSTVLRPLLFSIKEWAKPRGLNSPSVDRESPSFSSYAFALMTITFLQSEGLLPNLHADLPTLSPEELKRTAMWSRKPHRAWDVRFKRLENYTPPPEPSVDTLLVKWFQFWADFPHLEKCVSVRHGAFLDRDARELERFNVSKTSAPLCVIDPFLRVKNVTVSISHKVLEKFRRECQKTADEIAPSLET